MTVFLTADLGFGDAGKGSIVDYLARRERAGTVVRYNGGAQAAHNVVTADGRHHTFAQFGAGSFAGAATHLSRFMIVNPFSLVREGQQLQELGEKDIFARLTIDERALVTTPYHQAMNRLREISRGSGRHGSCGMGVGETRADFLRFGDEVLLAGDLTSPRRTSEKLRWLRQIKLDQLAEFREQLPDNLEARTELAVFEDESLIDEVVEVYEEIVQLLRIVPADYLIGVLQQDGAVIFEGAQGVLLDQWFGFHPYTTWSDVTFANAQTLLDEANYSGEVTRMGIVRGYMTRHGAGPFVTEDSVLSKLLPEPHNGTGRWQEAFRVGHFDLVAARYAVDVLGGVDELAVTCLDRLEAAADRPKVCVSYGRFDSPGVYENNRLLAGAKADRPWQERLTQFVEQVRPDYDSGPVDGFVAYLEARLEVPVTITSYGPTAADKCERPTSVPTAWVSERVPLDQ